MTAKKAAEHSESIEAIRAKRMKPAAEHSVVYDRKLKKVYFLTDPRGQSVELKPFVQALNDAEEKPGPQRFEIATAARTRNYPRDTTGRLVKPGVLEQAYETWVRDHPEFRMELVWSFSRSEFSFGYPRGYQAEGTEPQFGLLGSVTAFSQRADVEEDVARAYIRARMVELVGEAFVKKHAPELGVKPA